MRKSRSGDPYLPSMWEINRAAELGMTPEEYLKVGRDAEAYDRQLAEERAAKYGGGYAENYMNWDDGDE